MQKEYIDDIKINKYALDKEFEEQPSLYMKWSEKHATAVRVRDDLEQKRKVVRAELDTEYRQEYDRQKIKITEGLIDSAIRQDERHQKISNELIEAEEEVNIMESVKWAFEQRKKSLEWLAQLMIGGYYSLPKQPEEMKEQKIERGRETQRELRSSIRNMTGEANDR